jgi:hypothetical protein
MNHRMDAPGCFAVGNRRVIRLVRRVHNGTASKAFMHISLLIAGLLSICFGYRLFSNMSRGSLSSVSGAVLAMAGVFVLVGEAKAFAGHRTAAPTAVDWSSNWHNGASRSSRGRTHLTNII